MSRMVRLQELAYGNECGAFGNEEPFSAKDAGAVGEAQPAARGAECRSGGVDGATVASTGCRRIHANTEDNLVDSGRARRRGGEGSE